MAAPHYRFLPWARRGLATALTNADTGGALPARAGIVVNLTVENIGDLASPDLRLHGPGDIVGLDPRLILRTVPRHGTANAEPSRMAALDFDPPDLPWMFTPAAPSGARLRPWLVLVVLDLGKVQPPQLTRGALLPEVAIPGAISATELPDLSESWAWAHTQLAVDPDHPEPQGDLLAKRPERNVSRLICPRRLVPNTRYAACLVPAFDQGRIRGLGGTPDPAAQLGPAWTHPTPGEVRLPVYFHFEFGIGPEGDFESLARRLKPFRLPVDLGTAPMEVDTRDPLLAAVAGQPPTVLRLEGALRSPAADTVRREAVVPAPLAAAIGAAVDLGAPPDPPAPGAAPRPRLLAPPLYGGAAAGVNRLANMAAGWIADLNLDPRARAAAGLATKVVQQRQEELMQIAWRQVGDVVRANALLSLARLGMEALIRQHAKRIAPAPADRLMQFAAPMRERMPLAGGALEAAVARTSLPDAGLDPAFRRQTSPRRPTLRAAAQRLGGQAMVAGVGSARIELLSSMAKGRTDIDPTTVALDGVSTLRGLTEALAVPGATVALDSLGVTRALPRDRLEPIAAAAAKVTATPLTLRPRADLATTGLVTADHIKALESAASASIGAGAVATLNTGTAISALLQVARATPAAKEFSLDTQAGNFVLQSRIEATVPSTPVLTPSSPSATPTTPVHTPSSPVLAPSTPVVVRPDAGGLATRPLVTTPVTPRIVGRVTTGSVAAAANPAATVSGPAVARPGGAVEGVAAATPIAGQPGVSTAATGLGAAGTIGAGPVATTGAGTLATPGGLATTGSVATAGGVAGTGGVLTAGGGVTAGGIATAGGGAIGTAGGVAGAGAGGVLTATGSVVLAGSGIFATSGTVTTGTGAGTGATISTTIPPLVRDTAITSRFVTAFQRDAAELAVPAPARTLVPFALDAAAAAIRTWTDPQRTIPARTRSMLPGLATVPGLTIRPLFDRVMAYPTIDLAGADLLGAQDPERFLPGIGTIPADSICALETNPAFVAAFLAGLNNEMERELLWRMYPTDGRGSPFRRFWAWADGQPDVPPMHRWPAAQRLDLLPGGAGGQGQVVLLFRGMLMRRYPNTLVLAWRAAAGPNGRPKPKDPPADGDVRVPAFSGKFDPDIAYYGFDLTSVEVGGDPGWFFVIEEQPTEPEFGLDLPDGPLTTLPAGAFDQATWAHAGVDPGGHLQIAKIPPEGNALRTVMTDAMGMARASIQKPFRLFAHAKLLAVAFGGG